MPVDTEMGGGGGGGSLTSSHGFDFHLLTLAFLIHNEHNALLLVCIPCVLVHAWLLKGLGVYVLRQIYH